MAIEENTKSFLDESLSSQLENLGSEAEKKETKSWPEIPQSAPTKENPAKQEYVPVKTVSTKDLLDDSKEVLRTDDAYIYGEKGVRIKNYNDAFVAVLLGILIFLGLGAIAYFFYAYLLLESKPNQWATTNQYIASFAEYYDDYGQTFGLFDLNKYQNGNVNLKQGSFAEQTSSLLADERLTYVQKEQVLQDATDQLLNGIVQVREETKTMQEQLNRDGFFPEELVEILKKDNAVGSIQRSLLSLEIVKFTSAMKVFSLMDVFLSDLSSLLGPRKQELQERFEALIARGEGDVKNYLNYCYNNPYEPDSCTIIGDFDRYYRMSNRDQHFDTTFFKRLMGLINDKLELSQVPSFSITFNSFDGKSNSIAFTVEVNTLKEDEYALIKQGIKSPHIFIVSELIKLLKQSTFILGKAIDAKDVKVAAKKIEIGGGEYTVNNSVKTFTLPIQKETEREIFDYVDNYQLFLTQGEKKEKADPVNETITVGDQQMPEGNSEVQTAGRQETAETPASPEG